MKTTLSTLLFLLFSSNLFAEQIDCARQKRDMELFCGSLVRHCNYIQSCLIRRDTCVDGVPMEEESCERLSACSKKLEPELPKAERCKYEWSTSGSKPMCLVDKSIRFIEEACPGNIEGLLNAIAYGLAGTVDNDFDCSAAKRRYERKVEYCEKAREVFDNSCSKTVEDELAYLAAEPKKCIEAVDLDKFVPGQFFLETVDVSDFSENSSASDSAKKVETPEIRVLK